MTAFLVLAAVLAAPAGDADRVVVVCNDSSPISKSVASDYAKKRKVANVVHVSCQDSAESTEKETIPFAKFQEEIEKPLRAFLKTHAKVDFIVLTKGVPIRIPDAPGLGVGNNRPSVDSYLAALDYDKTPGAIKISIAEGGFKGTCWANRFWNSETRFAHAKFGGYLVTRLDGYTEDQARLLTAYALEAEKTPPTGKILLDASPSHGFGDAKKQPVPIFAKTPDPKEAAKALADVAYKDWNADLVAAAEKLQTRGLPVEPDKTDAFVARGDLMGYASWGSNDGHFDANAYHKLRFAPGGICETAVSTSARTFLPTTGGQSLIADLIAQRATGAKGYCDEPLLTAVASPTVLFDRYTRGWTLAESYYAASRYVGWEDIVVGDPLCRPYWRAKQ